MQASDAVGSHGQAVELMDGQAQETDLKQQFLEIQEALKTEYPETHAGYLVFRERYALFMQSYKRFLGQSTGGFGTISKEAAWNR